jgi:hypothetical protein
VLSLRLPVTWFALLLAICLAGPYLLGVPPRSHRDRLYLTITLAFLAWLLGLMAAVR